MKIKLWPLLFGLTGLSSLGFAVIALAANLMATQQVAPAFGWFWVIIGSMWVGLCIAFGWLVGYRAIKNGGEDGEE